jgi:hypothetical protein
LGALVLGRKADVDIADAVTMVASYIAKLPTFLAANPQI